MITKDRLWQAICDKNTISIHHTEKGGRKRLSEFIRCKRKMWYAENTEPFGTIEDEKGFYSCGVIEIIIFT